MDSNYYKYPRTPHLPFSPGKSSDDIIVSSLVHFHNELVVCTEKKDGENTNLYPNYYHARSITNSHHSSQSWLKAFHAGIKHRIPEGMRLCGENMYATHSIHYTDLPSYFLLFSVWEDDTCLSWDDTVAIAKDLGIQTVPVLWKSPFLFNKSVIEGLSKYLDTSKQEGFVIRLASSFKYHEFDTSVAKWVRPDHVQTDEHWKSKAVVPNKLA